MLIGNEIVNISISVVIAALVYSVAKDIVSDRLLPFCALAATVPVLLLFGEILPKTIAIKFSEKIALLNAYPLSLFSTAIAPLRHLLNSVSKVFIRLFVKDLTRHSAATVDIDEDIFRSMVDIGSKEGTVEPGERDLINRAFRLDDIRISHIMTSRDNVVAVPMDIREEDFIKLIEKHKFSRYPVYKEDIDTIAGFVHAKDLLRLRNIKRGKRHLTIQSIMRKPTFIFENRNSLSVLLQFQKDQSHMGVIVDNRRKTIGIVTMEDILEELFGEILDETDIEVERNE